MSVRRPQRRPPLRRVGLPRRETVKWWLHRWIEGALALLRRLGLDLAPQRVSALELAARGRATFEVLNPPEEVSVAGPFLHVDRDPGRLAQAVAEVTRGYKTTASGIVTLTHAQFELPSGLVTVDGSVPSETLVQRIWPHSYQYLRAWRMRATRGTEVQTGGLFTLPHWNNTYHWLAEMLPLALTLAEHTDVPFYIPSARPRFVSEYLRILDLESRCVELAGGVYRAPTLYVAAIPGCGLDRPSPVHVRKTRTALLEQLPDRKPPHRRLYVSREDAPDRRVRNEEELVALLEDQGFESVTLASLTVVEQIRLFSEAECVVGAHGAGMASIIVAPAGCCLIELFGNKVVNPMYLVLASFLGIRYGYVRATDVYRDLVAPVDDVRRAIEIGCRPRTGG
jgi:capsular polysaccharide biosynthesis protein